MARTARTVMQPEQPRFRYVRPPGGRRYEIPHFPEDRAVERLEADGHLIEVWHLSRLDWYEVRIDGHQVHVAGTLIECAREWRDQCVVWR